MQAALEAGWWPIAALILASSLLATVYIWRVVETAYFRPVPEGVGEASVPLSMLAPLWVLSGACIYFGIDSTRTLEVARSAAIYLLEMGP